MAVAGEVGTGSLPPLCAMAGPSPGGSVGDRGSWIERGGWLAGGAVGEAGPPARDDQSAGTAGAGVGAAAGTDSGMEAGAANAAEGPPAGGTSLNTGLGIASRPGLSLGRPAPRGFPPGSLSWASSSRWGPVMVSAGQRTGAVPALFVEGGSWFGGVADDRSWEGGGW